MDLYNIEGFVTKAKWIVISSLGGILLWASRTLQSPNKPIPKEHPYLHQCLHQPAGLKTLVYTSPGQSSSSSSMTTSLLPSDLTSSSTWSSVMDDLIGTDSGVCIISGEQHTLQVDKSEAVLDHNRNLGRRRQRCSVSKECPPPIPLLARTGNLPGHMSWALTRHYTDGKLILEEERVKHHQYFEAYRENGRLILNLVFFDDTITSNEEELELQYLKIIKEEEERDGYTDTGKEKPKEYEESVQADSNNMDCITKVEETTHKGGSINIMNSQMPKTNWENGFERYGVLRTCFTYTGREISDTSYHFFDNGDTHSEPGGAIFTHSDKLQNDLPNKPRCLCSIL